MFGGSPGAIVLADAGLVLLAERKARARAVLDDRESLSKGCGAPVNLSSCSPALSSRTYVDVATVVGFNASPVTRTRTSR